MRTDARIRYTKMRIRKAFFQCLREKPVSRITVTELCEIAEINRATFYSHYSDPADLLEKLEEEKLEAIRCQTGDGKNRNENLLRQVLEQIRSSQNEERLLTSVNGDPGFAVKMTQLYQQLFTPQIGQWLPQLPAEERVLVYRFLAGGCGSMISAWAESGMQLPPEELTEKIQQYVEAFLKSVEPYAD